MQTKTTLADLFRESVIFQGLIAVLCIVGTFTLLLLERPIPDYVWMIDATAVGFFFGARNLMTARNGAKEMAEVATKLAVENGRIVQTLSTMGLSGPMGSGVRGAMNNEPTGTDKAPFRADPIGGGL